MAPNPYPLGTPECIEWDEISRQVLARYVELRRALTDDEARPELAWPGEADEAEHAEAARALAASGVLFGPDVSQYQTTDWAKIKAAGCTFGIWKVSEGRTFLDPQAAHNQAGVAAQGLIPGCYHFLYFSQEYVDNPALWAAQARCFVQNAPKDAMHFLDVEAAATAGNHLGVREWVSEYRRLLPGHPLGVYTNRALWQNRSRMPYDPGPDLFDFAWHAGVGNGYYTSATGTIPAQWSAQGSLSNSLAGVGYPEVKLWQITDHASVPGVSGTCDGNAFQGTEPELRAYITGEDQNMPTADEIAAAVWGYPVTRMWDGKVSNTGAVLNSTHFYAIQGGHMATTPDTASTGAGSRTALGRVADSLAVVTGQTDTLEAAATAQSKALQDVVTGISSSVVAGLKDALPDTVQVDMAKVHDVVANALDEHMGTLRIVSDAPQPPQAS